VDYLETAKRAAFHLGRNPLASLGLLIISALLAVALFAPLIAPYDPVEINPSERLRPPSQAHLFGTDSAGRDIFSRVVFGTRISIRLGLLVIFLSALIGIVLGGGGAYLGGGIEEFLMRFTDMSMAFPPFVLAMAITATLGTGLTNVMVAISAIWWTVYARLIRSEVLAVKEEEYIEAGRALGASDLRILFRHILPNSFAPVLVQASMDFGFVIMMGAALGFIGLGAQPPSPEWGATISAGRSYLRTAWWYPTFPGLAIFVVVLGANLLGDGLRDILDVKLD